MYFDAFPSIGLVLKHASSANFSPYVCGSNSRLQLVNLTFGTIYFEMKACLIFRLANNIFIIILKLPGN